MKTTATRIIKFDAGHRVVGHESKCQTLHGHEYKLHLFAEADSQTLDQLGRVVDFSVLKEKIGSWIDLNFDHNMIIWKQDPNLVLLNQCAGLKKPFVTEFNPTAENIAEYLIKEICPKQLLGTGITITKIQLHETSNCYVEVTI